MLARREFLQRATTILIISLLPVPSFCVPPFEQISQSVGGAIRGTLNASGRPFADAEIILQSFANEKCAKLFEDKKPTPAKIARLNACSKDLPSIRPNPEGAFKFENLPPAWYALRFLWNINPRPSTAPLAITVGRFVVMYAGFKDESGRYDTMTQGRPFYFSGKTDFVIEFDYRKE